MSRKKNAERITLRFNCGAPVDVPIPLPDHPDERERGDPQALTRLGFGNIVKEGNNYVMTVGNIVCNRRLYYFRKKSDEEIREHTLSVTTSEIEPYFLSWKEKDFQYALNMTNEKKREIVLVELLKFVDRRYDVCQDDPSISRFRYKWIVDFPALYAEDEAKKQAFIKQVNDQWRTVFKGRTQCTIDGSIETLNDLDAITDLYDEQYIKNRSEYIKDSGPHLKGELIVAKAMMHVGIALANKI